MGLDNKKIPASFSDDDKPDNLVERYMTDAQIASLFIF